ncbi:hypothetical protein COT72_00010 [archaeon CG10_big_fil_rev_8_21_14_0_10_43_11]|nr:MAG: hypothetical protein COT72_00010 [archaeon CG10_big_fil_rev_8_21_14_0_10_43_11]
MTRNGVFTYSYTLVLSALLALVMLNLLFFAHQSVTKTHNALLEYETVNGISLVSSQLLGMPGNIRVEHARQDNTPLWSQGQTLNGVYVQTTLDQNVSVTSTGRRVVFKKQNQTVVVSDD